MHHFYCFQPIIYVINPEISVFTQSQVVRYQKRWSIIATIAMPSVASLAINLFKFAYSTTFSFFFPCYYFAVLDTYFHFSSHSYHTVLKCSTLACHSIEQKILF